MKTRVIVAVVVMIHCVAVGTLLMQGCRSTGGQSMSPERQDVTTPSDELVPVIEDVPVTETPYVETVEPVVPMRIETTTYVIRKGDTLSAIAKHYGVRQGDIMALNGLENANKLRVGQKLELPGIHDTSSLPPVAHAKPKAKKVAPATQAAAASADGDGYVIKKGDSLSTIAKSFGVSVKAIKEANNMTSDNIVAGRKLVIPGTTKPAPVDPIAPTGADAVIAPTTGESAPAPVDMTAPVSTDLTNSTVEKPDAIDISELDIDGGATTQPTDSTATAAPTTAPLAPSDYKMHTVSAGEDLSTIAIQWGVTEDDIRTLNGLGSEPLKEGQVLKIVPAH